MHVQLYKRTLIYWKFQIPNIQMTMVDVIKNTFVPLYESMNTNPNNYMLIKILCLLVH